MSAVIPAFNGEAFIEEAIESVLSQTYPVTECTVVDDGSADRTADIVRGFGPRVSLVIQPHSGPAAARNRGAALATGSLLAFLDQDDLWQPERLQRMVSAMTGAGAGAVICATRVLGEKPPMGSLVRMNPPQPSIESLLLWRGTVVSCGSNLLIERSAFNSLGGFDPVVDAVADWELLTRLATSGSRYVYLDEPLVTYRWHEENATQDRDEVERALERAYGIILTRHLRDLQISERRAYGAMHRMLAIAALRMGDGRSALRHGLPAVLSDPRGVAISAGRALSRRSLHRRSP